MQLTSLIVPTLTQMLRSLSAWIEKAAEAENAAGHNPDSLLLLRLAEDMHPLSAQIRFVCFQALEATYLLRGLPVPDSCLQIRTEGWEADARPGSLDDAQARIAQTLEALAELEENALDAGRQRPIVLSLPNGMTFDMTGDQYTRDWVLPQFYFHLMTAYALLRAHGIEIGKPDYVAHMSQYVRPDTIPPA